jgi:hypothetical protein
MSAGSAGRQGGKSAMAYDIAGDVRIDPRIKALLAYVPAIAGSDAARPYWPRPLRRRLSKGPKSSAR